MKRRGNRKSTKRRHNDVHRSELEQLEIRSMLSADLWQSLEAIPASETGAYAKAAATSYKGLALDVDAMRSLLATAPGEFSGEDGIVIELPTPDGGFERFSVYSTSVMHPDLAAKYTDIMTFVGYSLDNDYGNLRMDMTQFGFHAQVLNQDGSYLVDPYYHLEDEFYTSYFRADAVNSGIETSVNDIIDAHVHDDGDDHSLDLTSRGVGVDSFARSSGTELRVYATAIATTGEYTAQFGGTVAGGLAAVTTAMNRITGIYETELGIRFELVANNDQIIFTNAATDPYADANTFNDVITMATQNQTAVDNAIGAANYDVGHVFGYSPAGLGGYGPGPVGLNGQKAMGATVLDVLDADVFYVDYVSHEIGHQFSANHTWSYCGGPNSEGTGAAVEPGSGATIMGYAGICGPDDIAMNSVPYFSAFSFDQIISYVDDTIPTVGTRVATGNQIPTVDAGADYVIPANTPFVLTATGSDPEGNALTYSWEQMDAGTGAPLAAGDTGANAIYQFVAPSADPSRYFPSYDNVLNNTTSNGEVFPTTDRDLNFRVTVRDNNGTYTAINNDDTVITVVDTGAPFQFTMPAGGENLVGGEMFTFTWDVAGTNAGPINAQNVRITMSVDGGLTFTEVVTDSTANDGSEELAVPNVASTLVRFRIEAVGNVFYDITNANLTVELGAGGGATGSIDVCGVALPEGTTSFAGAVGGNFFASNHAILDGTDPGQQGYDEVILDFLRGSGTSTEIPKSQYSIAVVGNGDVAWAFSNGTQEATGYERTDFYNINYIDPSVFNELIAHDLIIVLSSESAVTDGLSTTEMALWATVESNIANAVNDRGLDLWVGASGGDATYHDFLPTGALTTTAEAGIDPLDGFEVTVEGQLLGITDTMVDAADATFYYSAFDNDLSSLEQRFIGESISVAAAGIAFFNDQIMPAADVPGGTTQGMVGLAFEDLNMNGFHDPIEQGIGGARFFIDYNGDGLIGLCEPTATANAAGQFVLRSAYSGTFQIMPVPTAGSVVTTTTPIYVTIADDGSATLNAPLEFGVIAGADSGNGGLGGSTPVAQGAYLGASPIADDGVFFGNGIKKGTNTVTITSSVVHSNVVMNAWIDLNKDGDFNDANERIFTNVKLTPGQKDYTFTIPQNVFDDSVLPDAARLAANMRFRVGPTLNIGPTADDAFGEIEDYKVFITQPADTGLVATDDVFTYLEDTDGQVFNVLANDSSFFNRSLTIVPGSVANISPVTVPPLDIYVSPDGTRIIFDAAGVMDLTEDITFEYTVQDSAGVMETATVTLVAPVDPMASPAATNLLAFNNKTLAADVNNDGNLTSVDYITLLRELRTNGTRALPNFGSGSTNFNMFIDINADGRFSSLDLLKLSDILETYKSNGESLEQEPASTGSVETLSAMPVVEIAAPISKQQSSVAAPVSQTSGKFAVVASDLVIASETGDSDSVETQVVPDEAAAELAFSSLGSEQNDLLWSDSDELEFSSSDGEAEDDVFADPEWDSELLSY
ncbi:reprolysin-like metallopeptidase [Bremerella sp.]|uniref:reprolysin-like metallopeptidase n=1 Tax=Bremerella sp. TaxID=2795602 RepID=UPI00391AA6B3